MRIYLTTAKRGTFLPMLTYGNLCLTHTELPITIINPRQHCQRPLGAPILLNRAKHLKFQSYVLRTRFGDHKSNMLNSKQDPVSEHFNMIPHSLEDVMLIGIEIVWDGLLRLQRQTFYINYLQDNMKILPIKNLQEIKWIFSQKRTTSWLRQLL